MRTIPSQWPHSLFGACGLRPPLVVHSPPHTHASDLGPIPPTAPWEHRTGGWLGGETGAVAAREFSKVPPRVFFFWGKSSCLILWLSPYKEGPVLSLSPPLQLDWVVQVRVPHGPTLNSQLSPVGTRSLCGFTTLSLFPSLRLQATRSLSVLLKPCFMGEGALSSALSQESCGRPSGCRPGATVTLVPALVPGTF